MCMIDSGERYDVYSAETRKAAKPHKCDECHREIAKGETYRLTKGMYDRLWSTNKVCAHCMVVVQWLGDNCGGYMDGGVFEDIVEHVEEYRRMDLARVAVGMRHKWKRIRREGQMPIPKLPRPIKLGDALP